jgi:amino acid adenylation domain-containing protein
VPELGERFAQLSPAQRRLLLQRLGRGRPQAPAVERIPRQPRDGRLFPLSFAQQRLWFLDQLEPGRPWYNMPLFLRLRGPLAPLALARAFAEIERRHEVLRTIFTLADEQAAQVIGPCRGLALPLADLAGLPAAAAAAEVERLLAAAAARPFELARGPLWRALLLRLGERDHVLQLALHHIVCDGWSLDVLVREIGALYEAHASGRPAALPPLPIQYADFAVWQRQALAGEGLARQLDYWKGQLAGSPPVLELPADRPRPAHQSLRGRTLPLPIPEVLWSGVRDLGRRLGATPFMILLAVFKAVLRHHARQPDVVVGTPVANRGRSEIEGLIGFFVNTLVLRTDLSGDPAFGGLVARVKRVVSDASAHQDLPFELLVDVLQIERRLDHNPLFQVMFILQRDPLPVAEIAGLSLAPMEVAGKTAKFDLMLQLWEQPHGLAGFLEYNTDLFDAATVLRFGDHFATLLAGAVGHPERPLSALVSLGPGARHQIVAEWNDTADSRLAPGACLHDLFRAQAGRTPDAVALSWEGGAWSYGELGRRAAVLAGRLRRLGVGPDVPVGICMRRSPEMAVAVLGVLAAGGAYLPLDPAYPRQRLARMLEAAGTPVLLAQADLLLDLSDLAAGDVAVISPAAAVAGAETDEELPAKAEAGAAAGAKPDNLAYVIFTSGSTGEPKGVALPHRALVNLCLWQRGQSAPGAGAKTLQFASLSFDVSCQELFATWAAGGALVLISEAVRLDAAALLETLVREEVERLFLPFVALQQLAETAAERGLYPRTLREVVTAGEQLQATGPIVDFFTHLPSARLWNQYGPSESHVATAFALTGPPRDWPALPAIGRPIANSRVHLLDEASQPVLPGVPGELHIGGTCLARGYFRRPELTAERFVPDPTGGAGQRLYRTGDLARYRPDGDLEFLGRNDQQAKIRGFRVEPAEIEAALAALPGVREAAVVARAARGGGERPGGPRRLVAYVVPGEPAPTAAELRGRLRESLPEHMVPAAFQLLPALPLTPSGKVDRRALPAPEPGAGEPEPACLAPRTPLEELLAGIWRELLDVERVGVRDSFFDLGGHSLLAVRLMARIRRQCGRDLPLAALFAGPTIERLAALLGNPAAAPARRGAVVELEAGEGSERPVFVVHPVGGGVLCYAGLARALGPGRPLYGLQSPDWEGEEPATLEDMAERYVAALRGIQPRGPYRLGGWSMGGVTAFEMARQLRQQGEEIEALFLLDSYAPGHPGGVGGEDLDEAAVRALFARDLAGLLGRELPAAAARLERLGPETPLAEAFAEAQAAGLFPVELDLAETLRMLAVFRANLRCLQRYAGAPYPGRVILFRAAGPTPAAGADGSGATLGWEALAAAGVEVEPVAGDHYDLLRPPAVEALAARLGARLGALLSRV